jgi:hypothetical protein
LMKRMATNASRMISGREYRQDEGEPPKHFPDECCPLSLVRPLGSKLFR